MLRSTQPGDDAVATHDVEGGARSEEGGQLLGNEVRRLLHNGEEGTLRYGSHVRSVLAVQPEQQDSQKAAVVGEGLDGERGGSSDGGGQLGPEGERVVCRPGCLVHVAVVRVSQSPRSVLRQSWSEGGDRRIERSALVRR